MRFSEVVAGGACVPALEALRDVLAGAIEGTDSARDLAALSKQLVDVLTQIEAAGGAVKVDDPEESTFDELTKRRSARGAGSKSAVLPTGG